MGRQDEVERSKVPMKDMPASSASNARLDELLKRTKQEAAEAAKPKPQSEVPALARTAEDAGVASAHTEPAVEAPVVPAPPPPEPDPVDPAQVQKVRVTKVNRLLSYGGAIMTLNVGTILNPVHYLPGTINRWVECGAITVEPVE